MERIKLSKIEQKVKRMEMKEMKSNLWKWRGKDKRPEYDKTCAMSEMEKLDENLKKAELALERTRLEKEQRLRRADQLTKASKQKSEEKRMRLAKKERLESSWKMLKWATEMLEHNSDAWDYETGEPSPSSKMGSLEEWESMTEGEKRAELNMRYSQTSLAHPARGRLKKKRKLPDWMIQDVKYVDTKCSPSHIAHPQPTTEQIVSPTPTTPHQNRAMSRQISPPHPG